VGQLHQRILAALREELYVVSDHADNQVRDRGIMIWQVVAGCEEAALLAERQQTRPNPTVELDVVLADGTRVKAVWGLIESTSHAKLVTVHFFDR
jgi:hypothetical protein